MFFAAIGETLQQAGSAKKYLDDIVPNFLFDSNAKSVNESKRKKFYNALEASPLRNYVRNSTEHDGICQELLLSSWQPELVAACLPCIIFKCFKMKFKIENQVIC